MSLDDAALDNLAERAQWVLNHCDDEPMLMHTLPAPSLHGLVRDLAHELAALRVRLARAEAEADAARAIRQVSTAAHVAETQSARWAAAAFEALAMRLWADDRPEDCTLRAIDDWTAGLPEDEAAALNAMLGESFGRGPAWDSDHWLSAFARAEAEAEDDDE